MNFMVANVTAARVRICLELNGYGGRRLRSAVGRLANHQRGAPTTDDQMIKRASCQECLRNDGIGLLDKFSYTLADSADLEFDLMGSRPTVNRGLQLMNPAETG